MLPAGAPRAAQQGQLAVREVAAGHDLRSARRRGRASARSGRPAGSLSAHAATHRQELLSHSTRGAHDAHVRPVLGELGRDSQSGGALAAAARCCSQAGGRARVALPKHAAAGGHTAARSGQHPGAMSRRSTQVSRIGKSVVRWGDKSLLKRASIVSLCVFIDVPQPW